MEMIRELVLREENKHMRLSDIKIPEAFVESKPSIAKYAKCDKIYKKTGLQDRYIIVNENNILIDGYIMYLVLKNNGVEYGEGKRLRLNGRCYTSKKRKKYGRAVPPSSKTEIYKNIPTMYVYGIHPNSVTNTEYVWRLRQNWIDMGNELQVGDRIYCRTRFGISPVIVTRIEKKDRWDGDLDVKQVASKKIIRNGEKVAYKKL